ncbi:hypothetical protein [Oceanobacter mangrovi]|uniref:hypothetical protein n=1 Tax=Oceanobacter mangrovi TaxID=2862510 RepID=UPI001C8D1F37|nr:hypothetical protein [Oceanobacter mangrovi]
MTEETLALLVFAVIFLGFMTILPLWFVLTVFTPEKLLSTCFQEPFFTKGELIMMQRSPGRYLRTSIFAWGLVFPGLIAKRGIEGFRQQVPLLFQTGCYLFIAIFTLMAAGLLTLPFFDAVHKAINALFY